MVPMASCGVLRYDDPSMNDTQRHSVQELSSAGDTELTAWAQAGDAQAFETLVRRYRNDVFALSYHFVRNRDTAWDISQEVFIKVYRALRWFRGDAGFKTWLMRITANQCKDWLRKRTLETVPLDEALGAGSAPNTQRPDSALSARELGAAIEKALASLPPKHQEAFVLREYEGLSYEQMAGVMRCNTGTVMSRLHHARKKLQRALVRMGAVEDPGHE